MDYNERIDGALSDKYDFYNNSEKYQSSFLNYTKHADIFIAGHFYGSGSPYLFTREDAKSDDFNLQVVADISCDIDGPVASTIRSSTIKNPIYGYNPETESEDDFKKIGVIAVMAVDNLPCELPKDASEYFAQLVVPAASRSGMAHVPLPTPGHRSYQMHQSPGPFERPRQTTDPLTVSAQIAAGEFQLAKWRDMRDQH